MDCTITLSAQLQQFLRSQRRHRGMTQRKLARCLGVGQSRIAAIERDPGAVSFEQLLEVLILLNAQLIVRSREDAPARLPSSTDEAWPVGEW